MDLFSKRNIKNLLEKHQIRPSKQLGQHFLIDKGAARKIIEAAQLKKEDVVLEIGPGIGNLTQELAKRVKKVIAAEKDRKMVEIVKETLKDFQNIEIIQGDILKIFNSPARLATPSEAGGQFSIFNKFSISNYKIVGNLPFYLTAPVIRKFLESVDIKPQQMVLTIQKEVAQRICSKPPDMSLLAVSVQFYAKPEIISYISKKSFWPMPKVDSAIIRINPQINTDRKLINTDLFFKVVKAGFSQPRKQILNNLAKGLALSQPKGLKLDKTRVKSWLLKNKINPQRRAETLSIADWVSLTKSFNVN